LNNDLSYVICIEAPLPTYNAKIEMVLEEKQESKEKVALK
jgi:hypothetical protein